MDNKQDRALKIEWLDPRAVQEVALAIVPRAERDLMVFNRPFPMKCIWLPWHQWRYVNSYLGIHKAFNLYIDDMLYMAILMEGLPYLMQISETEEQFRNCYYRRLLYIPDTVPKNKLRD